MKNVTLSLDEKELERARQYALERGLSLNAFIRELLSRTVHPSSSDWMQECFDLMDQAKTGRKVRSWKREDLYDV